MNEWSLMRIKLFSSSSTLLFCNAYVHILFNFFFCEINSNWNNISKFGFVRNLFWKILNFLCIFLAVFQFKKSVKHSINQIKTFPGALYALNKSYQPTIDFQKYWHYCEETQMITNKKTQKYTNHMCGLLKTNLTVAKTISKWMEKIRSNRFRKCVCWIQSRRHGLKGQIIDRVVIMNPVR